jgi:hypothetical protein
MKMKPTVPRLPGLHQPEVDEVRDYALHLYVESGGVPGQDVDNWLEAEACLRANIPKHRSHLRLHHHLAPERIDDVATFAGAGIEAKHLAH